jgi:GAF domain-containing protein
MKYRLRIWLILLLIGLIPLVAAGFVTLRIVNQIPSMHIDQSQGTVSAIDIRSVRMSFLLTYSAFGFITLVAAYIISGRVASPVEWMAASASQFLRIMKNIWKSLQPPDTKNEMITLGYTFSVFTQQIRDEIANLEKQVQTRTADLAGRTAQLETAAQVARESAAILDIDQLLNKTTQLISERFGYYHAGIFLLDEAAETSRAAETRRAAETSWAAETRRAAETSRAVEDNRTEEYLTLQAANSEGGQRMLARGHKLRVGQGIVGTVAAKNEPRIATDVGVDAAYFNNPDLPQTHSELALPLRVRTKIIGVLDVQSTEAEAYKDEDIKILQILADQLALAIDNARLIKESQRNLHALEIAYGQEAKQAWERRLAKKPLAYIYNRIDVRPIFILPVSPASSPLEAQNQLVVPIIIRGQALGNITLRRDNKLEPWNKDDQTLVEDAVVQIALALENARLLEEIRSRAQQEQLISQVSAQFQGSLDIDAVLRVAVRQLGQLPGVSEASIHISPETVGNK